LQSFEAAFQGRGDGLRAAGDEPLHQDHQEAEVLPVLTHRLVVAQADVLRDRLVQVLLERVLLFPAHGHELREPGHEQRIALVVDGPPLLGADHERCDLLLADRRRRDELIPVEQCHDPLEARRLALVRRGRKQEQVRGGFGQGFAEPVAGDLFGASAEAMGFVADNQIPTGVDQIAEAFLVVRFQLLTGPAPATFDGLDRIGRTDDLIELPPDVLGPGEVPPRRELARRQEPELLAEVGLHFLHPLRHEALGGDDQHPLHQPTELEFPEDQPGFDGLAQTDFIGEQVTHPVAGDGTSESVKLVRQRDDARFERGQQHVLSQSVGDPGGGDGVGDAVEAGRLRRLSGDSDSAGTRSTVASRGIQT
jgi:hypothetical protein